MSAPAHDDAPIEELEARAKAAVAAFRDAKARTNRGPDGRLLPGHTITMKTGLHSAHLAEHPDVAAWCDARVESIESDLGGAAELSTMQRGLVREVARLELIVTTLGEDLLASGTLTGKGRVRSATTTYLTVLDRYLGLCKVLGIRRQARRHNALLGVVPTGGEA